MYQCRKELPGASLPQRILCGCISTEKNSQGHRYHRGSCVGVSVQGRTPRDIVTTEDLVWVHQYREELPGTSLPQRILCECISTEKNSQRHHYHRGSCVGVSVQRRTPRGIVTTEDLVWVYQYREELPGASLPQRILCGCISTEKNSQGHRYHRGSCVSVPV